jgi:hypothetical protein
VLKGKFPTYNLLSISPPKNYRPDTLSWRFSNCSKPVSQDDYIIIPKMTSNMRLEVLKSSPPLVLN